MIAAAPSHSPTANLDLIETVAESGNGLVDLWEASPVRLDSNKPRTDEVIDILFPGNPLLCCGWSRHHFDTRRRTRWHKLHDLQFIVPNPMASRLGLTRRRKLSPHALSNTASTRRFLVIEFDFDGSSPAETRLLCRLRSERRDVRDLCAALLLHLAEMAPLALAVHSGGKSLHGWFYCEGRTDAQLEPFMRYAVSLGADRATWGRSQFCRMPDGMRDKVIRQSIFFFNPEAVQ